MRIRAQKKKTRSISMVFCDMRCLCPDLLKIMRRIVFTFPATKSRWSSRKCLSANRVTWPVEQSVGRSIYRSVKVTRTALHLICDTTLPPCRWVAPEGSSKSAIPPKYQIVSYCA